jgi:hypothetical protein
MSELTPEVKKLQDQIEQLTINASAVKYAYPELTGSWWKIEGANLAAMQYISDQKGNKLEWDDTRKCFWMQASDYRNDVSMTLFIYSHPVKARMIYEDIV